MTLLKRIQSDQLQARKDKDTVKATVLTTLIGEAAMIGKNDGNRESTDEEVTKVITKFIKGIDETLALVDSNTFIKQEKQILMAYMPKQLTSEELSAIIKNEFADKPTVKDVMSFLKANYNGQYDGKVASGLVIELQLNR